MRNLTEDQKKLEDQRAAEYSKKKKTVKKDPKKKPGDKTQNAVNVDEEQFENRIYWGFGQAPINFEIQAAYQGPDYPNPAKEKKEETEAKEEKKTKPDTKAKKKDQKEEPDFLTPAPVVVIGESNRNLQFKMSNIDRSYKSK